MQTLINEIRKLIEYSGENGTITKINKIEQVKQNIAKLGFCKSSFMPKKCLTKNFQISLLENMIKSHILF